MRLQDRKLQDKKEAKKMAILAARVIEDKKLEDIVVLELSEDIGLSDYFIIATASSSPQMKAGIDAVYKAFKDEHIHPYGNSENSMDSLWSLIDYGFLVVHIFTKEGREFYELDKLWHECKRVSFHSSKTNEKSKEEKDNKEKYIKEEVDREAAKKAKKAKKEIKKVEKVKKEAKIKKDNKAKDIYKKSETKKSVSKKSAIKKSVSKKLASKKSAAKKTVKKLSKKTSGNKSNSKKR